MASSDDIKNALVDIKDALEDLKDETINIKNVLVDTNKHLTISNMAHSRNARANDISWKLSASDSQISSIAETRLNTEQEQSIIRIKED